jgi:hypothetical protein
MASPAYTANVILNGSVTQSIDQLHVGPYGKTGTAAQAFVDHRNTECVLDDTTTKVKPKFIFHKDIAPERDGSNRFGDNVVIRFGQEFPGANVGQELHIRLPRLRRTDHTFTSANGNPRDAGYVGAGGSADDFLQWKRNVGELVVFGGLSQYLEQTHGPTEILDRRRAWMVHIKRRLCDDDIRSAFRTAYLNAMGGDRRLNTDVAIDLIVRLPAPWAPDCGESFDRYLPQQAYAEQFEYRFPLPPLNELCDHRMLDAPTSTSYRQLSDCINTSLSEFFPRMALRTEFFNTDPDQKNADAQLVINQGVSLKVHRMVAERSFEVDANNAATEHAIEIEAPKMPVAYIVAVVNYLDDLRPTGQVATAAHGETDLSKKRTALINGVQVLVRPDPFNFIPPVSWHIQDNSERITNIHDMHWWLNSAHGGYTTRFPSTPTEKFAVICPSTRPDSEKDTFGFIDHTTMHKPRFYITIPGNDANNSGQRRVIRLMYVFENAIEQKDGAMHLSLFHTLA